MYNLSEFQMKIITFFIYKPFFIFHYYQSIIMRFTFIQSKNYERPVISEICFLVCFAVGVAGYRILDTYPGYPGYDNSVVSLRSIDSSIPTDQLHLEDPIYYKRSDYDDIFNVKRAPSSIASLFQSMNEPNWR